MDWLTFISSMTSSLAWPALILVLVCIFFRQGLSIEKIIGAGRSYFKTLKVGSVELTFQDARADAEAVAAEIGEPPPPPVPDQQIVEWSNRSSGVAVLDIWRPLELKIRELMSASSVPPSTPQDVFVRNLLTLKLITLRDITLYERLRKIRNAAVHSIDPQFLTVAEIAEYKTWVDTFVVRLGQIEQKMQVTGGYSIS